MFVKELTLKIPVSFTEPQIFINHCLLTKIYVERGNTQMDRGEIEAGRNHCQRCVSDRANSWTLYWWWLDFKLFCFTWHKHTISTHRFRNTLARHLRAKMLHVPLKMFNLRLQTIDYYSHIHLSDCNTVFWYQLDGVYSVVEWSAMVLVGADAADISEHYSCLKGKKWKIVHSNKSDRSDDTYI